MKKIFDDGILEAILYRNRWVFCRWIQNQHGRLQKKLIRDIRLIEAMIQKENLVGWFTRSEPDHSEFHRLLEKFGCQPREIDNEGYKVFIKPFVTLNKKVVV